MLKFPASTFFQRPEEGPRTSFFDTLVIFIISQKKKGQKEKNVFFSSLNHESCEGRGSCSTRGIGEGMVCIVPLCIRRGNLQSSKASRVASAGARGTGEHELIEMWFNLFGTKIFAKGQGRLLCVGVCQFSL